MNTTATAPTTKTLAQLEAELNTAKSQLEKGGFAEADFKLVKSVQAAIATFNTNKEKNVKDILEKINSFGFTVLDIYTEDDLKSFGYAKIKKAKKPSTPRTKTERESDKATELFFIAKGEGKGSRDFVYNKGRIYEEASDTVKSPFAAVPKTLESNVKTKEDLLKFVSPKSKNDATTYLNSPAGQKEIQAILDYIKNDELKASDLKARP